MSKKNNTDFIRSTVDKLQDYLSKFILDTNYSNTNSLTLRAQLNNLQDKLNLQDYNKKKQNQSLSLCLPRIATNQNEIQSPNTIYTLNPKKFGSTTMSKLNNNIQDELKRSKRLKGAMKNYQNELCKNNSNSAFRNIASIINIDVNDPNYKKYVSVGKYLKYSNEQRYKNFKDEIQYDENNLPIIRSKNVNKGLLDMINKGYIPKVADLSPAFQKNGSPMTIDKNNVKVNYRKHNFRDDLPNEKSNINAIKYVLEDADSNNNDKDTLDKGVFITSKKSNFSEKKVDEEDEITNANNNNYDKPQDEVHSVYLDYTNTFEKYNKNKIYGKGLNLNYNYSNNSILNKFKIVDINSNNNTYQSNKNSNNVLFIDFENTFPIKNNNLQDFLNGNQRLCAKILYILENLSNILKKLYIFSRIKVRTNVILSLVRDMSKMSNISNRDLLLCVEEDDLKNLGFDINNSNVFLVKLKEIYALKIQRKYRQYIARVKYESMRYQIEQIIKIQNWYIQKSIYKSIQKELNLVRNYKKQSYLEILGIFKENWKIISESKRVEIHINSLSYSNYKNTTIDKYPEKENLQLNRLIRLIDPNIEIIYISPYEISDDIIKYYISILNTIGINNIEQRLHLIVPEYASYFPPHYSLTQLLYFSTRTQMKIKSLIKDKNAYIIPGMVSALEEEISVLLECPILMGDYEQISLIFNKSGAKSAFEMNEIAFPISAWDIKTEEEFYSSLAHLIATYASINIWIFKINNENQGRGIAYLDVSKIDRIQFLKKEKNINPSMTIDLLQEKLFLFLNSNLKNFVKIVYPAIYPNWETYMKNYIKYKGVIESCPTNDLNGVMGSPALPILIEPNGRVKVLPTYDKINEKFFKNIFCVSPQKSLLDIDLNGIGEKIGEFLYKQNVIGYITIELITFNDGKKIIFWGIDMKFGLTDQISSLQYSYFLYIQSTLLKNKELDIYDNYSSTENLTEDIDYAKIINNAYSFTLPYISNKDLNNINLKDFLSSFRYDSIIFDINKKEGIIFNLPDSVECGILGICGIINLNKEERRRGEYRLWEIAEKSLKNLLVLCGKNRKKTKVKGKDIYSNSGVPRNDIVDLQLIYSKIKVTARLKGKIFTDEKKKLNVESIFS